MHPSETIKEKSSSKLAGKTIVLGVTGGIAAVQCVKLIRELIRHGADIIPVMTKEACKIITPLSLEFASGTKVITDLTGKTEHVTIKYDAMIIAPCSANTIAKLAIGIADNAVTTFSLTASKLIVAPTMHKSMYEQINIKNNIEKCTKNGIIIIPPNIDENKAKMAGIEDIVSLSIRNITGKIKNKNILIIGGATHQPIDDVRELTNISSGKMATALAKEAYYQGFNVMFWASFLPPTFIESKSFKTIDDLKKLISDNSKKYDIIINCAAISDFITTKVKGKISSKNELHLKFEKAIRINPLLKEITKKLISFKLISMNEDVLKRSLELISSDNVDIVVCNRVNAIGADTSTVWICTAEGINTEITATKHNIAEKIITTL